MITVISDRAKKLLSTPQSVKNERMEGMRRYPGKDFDLWVGLEWDNLIVKNLSFFGELTDGEKVLLESVASLMKGKNPLALDKFSVRECEAFLRDRNSVPALGEIDEASAEKFRNLFQWMKAWPRQVIARDYEFHSQNAPFRTLKLVDKVKEIKGFLSSPEIVGLYQGSVPPVLVDVDDLTVFIQVPYETAKEKSLFEELHILGVSAFQEENLNFIPEA